MRAPPGEPAAISFAAMMIHRNWFRRRALLGEKTSKPNNRCYLKPHAGPMLAFMKTSAVLVQIPSGQQKHRPASLVVMIWIR